MIGLVNSTAIRIPLADESVHVVVTSPPYWGALDFATIWWYNYCMRTKKGHFRKGERASPQTEFKKGQHWRKPQLYWDRNWLYQEYIVEQKSTAQIANEQGCKENNILYFLKKHGIPTRTTAEVRAIKHWGASGPDNPMYGRTGASSTNWKGGCTPGRQALYSSREWAEVVRIVWARDKALCQRCGTKKQASNVFHIHHIVSFSAIELRVDPENLVLVCRMCHHWIHSKSNVHKEYMKGGG